VINVIASSSNFAQAGTQYPESNWVKEVSQEQLLKEFEDFEEQVQQLFKVCLYILVYSIPISPPVHPTICYWT
jgi:hypothetical protein